MSSAKIALLEDRGVVAVTGEDAGKFLQGLITNDLEGVSDHGAVFAALLTPQGKILFDFFVVKSDEGFLLDVPHDQAEALVKRLSMYKLRAKVDVRPQDAVVAAGWNFDPGEIWPETDESWADPRNPELGRRGIVEPDGWARVSKRISEEQREVVMGTQAEHYAHRISLGIPEGGKDFAWSEAFPHEANMDRLNGLSFDKGCYVGQEIVSRMEHRGTARRRFVRVAAAAPLPPAGTEVKAGDVTIGAMGTSVGGLGLALLRLDRVVEFEDLGIPLTAAGVTIAPRRDDLVRFGVRAASAAS